MIGSRNSLEKQAVCVQVNLENAATRAKEPAVAYLQLDTWAVDQETLALDLARDEFPKPGTLFVWFFRGDQTVWEEQIQLARVPVGPFCRKGPSRIIHRRVRA